MERPVMNSRGVKPEVRPLVVPRDELVVDHEFVGLIAATISAAGDLQNAP
jgi:hypothetical protein